MSDVPNLSIKHGGAFVGTICISLCIILGISYFKFRSLLRPAARLPLHAAAWLTYPTHHLHTCVRLSHHKF